MALKLSVSLSTDRSTGRVWNSAERSLRIALTQQNAFLWVRVWNSAKRFPMGPRLELSKTLSYGSAFGTQQNALYGSRSRLKLKAKYRITFLSYNLLTEAENAAGFIQAFLL
ncbi:hypothetical protein [Leptospira interrogans]|uniref:hypothetical protein n=1 Tax=Leptospira interrogans TaxID=173 RepID=UPI0007747AE7|nr:hypothetical protein [Leptospira interrogans]